MTLSKVDLEVVGQHWALEALGAEGVVRARKIAAKMLVRRTLGKKLAIGGKASKADLELLEKTSTAYELAGIEGLNALLNPSANDESRRLRTQAQAATHLAFEFRRELEPAGGDGARIFHVLHTAGLAYCGDRWTDLQRWLRESPRHTRVPSANRRRWDTRVLYQLFDCWIRLLRKDSWEDLSRVAEIIVALRREQRSYEATYLKASPRAKLQARGLRLIALYHWAKATELLATFMLQGTPHNIRTLLDQHFEAAVRAAEASHDMQYEVVLRWLHVAGRQMAQGSVWALAHAANSPIGEFVRYSSRHQNLIEFLPPQRAALLEEGLLDPAARAVVVELPTSGGKTTLAKLRMLQAVELFKQDRGWVAYVAPTRALVAQIARNLRRDFSPLKIKVEQLSAAVDIDAFETDLLQDGSSDVPFHILVVTPEKLQLLIRNQQTDRPLSLVVMDEAHNIENDSRGLRIELLLATIKMDQPRANFLLMMPFVPNAGDLAQWLAPDQSRTVSMGAAAWKPNDRLVGTFQKVASARRGDWTLDYEAVTTTHRTLELSGRHQVGSTRPLAVTSSGAEPLYIQAGAMAHEFAGDTETCIAVANNIGHVWKMAKLVAEKRQPISPVPEPISLVQRYMASELGDDFALVELLSRRIAVHHAGLPYDVRTLIELLTEDEQIRVLCATNTIAQGLNFPVAGVFLASTSLGYGKRMSSRDFWNLAGRAGRIQHGTLGVVGLAAGDDVRETKRYISAQTGELVSQLTKMLDQLDAQGKLNDLTSIVNDDQWADFRAYVAHLYAQTRDLEATLAATEQLLRNTYGYSSLKTKSDAASKRKSDALRQLTQDYVRDIDGRPQDATLADSTGFAPEGVRSALGGLGRLRLTPSQWQPESLFGSGQSSALAELVGVMMRVPQLRKGLEDLAGKRGDEVRVAQVAQDWVGGKSIQEIAVKYFEGKSTTDQISSACREIYRSLSTFGSWGLAGLSQLPTSGLDFTTLSEEQQRTVNLLPAMIYHGVKTEDAVLLRMNSVPRSLAESLGEQFRHATSRERRPGLARAAEFLHDLPVQAWKAAAPSHSTLSGQEYRDIWKMLRGSD